MAKSYHVISNPVAFISDGRLIDEGDGCELYDGFETAEDAVAAAKREALAQLDNGKCGFSWMRDHDNDAVVVYEYGIGYNEFEVEAWDDEDDESEPETIEIVDAIELSDMLGRLVRQAGRNGWSFWNEICWDSEVIDETTDTQLINWRGMWGDLQCLRVGDRQELLLPDFSNGERYVTVVDALKLGTWSHVWEDDANDAALMYKMVDERVTC